MELTRKYLLSGLLFLFLINTSVISQEEYEYEEEVQPRFHAAAPGPPCSYRRQEGVCRRRSQCTRPTRHRCRLGLDPVVCCLDPPTTAAPTTTRRTTPKRTTHKNTERPTTKRPEPERTGNMDLTFPNCGRRSSKAPQQPTSRATQQDVGGRGLLSRAGGVISSLVRGNVDLKEKVIVGGVEAKEHSWPWMTAVFKQSVPGGPKRFLCGASLISRRYVLTAAHCFDNERKDGADIDASKFSAVLGSHQTKDGAEYAVESVLVHGAYVRRQHYNDLCVLRLKGQVALSSRVRPVCLPSDGLRDRIRVGENKVTVTGWGDTSFGGVASKVLHEVELPVVPLKECNASYWKIARATFPRGITPVFLCAGVKEGGKDACQGDSGGPLVSALSDGSWVQLGVVSFGYGCAQPGFPGVYTRLTHFTQWLQHNTDLGEAAS